MVFNQDKSLRAKIRQSMEEEQQKAISVFESRVRQSKLDKKQAEEKATRKLNLFNKTKSDFNYSSREELQQALTEFLKRSNKNTDILQYV